MALYFVVAVIVVGVVVVVGAAAAAVAIFSNQTQFVLLATNVCETEDELVCVENVL